MKISTPITSDRYGNIFFGFEVSGVTVPPLKSGIARISEDGAGTWISASAAAASPSVIKVALNAAPALSNDHNTLYVAVSFGNYAGGYLVAYALGLDALIPELSALSEPVLVNNYLTFSYVPGPSDVTCSVEFSTNLLEWGTVDVEPVIIANPIRPAV